MTNLDDACDEPHRRDLREGQTWTRPQAWKNDALYALVRVALWVVRPLPSRLLRGAGRLLGAIALVIFPAARRIARANVAKAFPHLSRASRDRLVARAYVTLGAHLGDAAAALDPTAPLVPLPFAPGAREVLEAARAEGRGVVFASAHLGPWERVAASLVAAGLPLTTLARESYDPRLNALYDRLRGGRGVGVIYRGHPGAASRIVRVLRSGAILGAPMDLRSRVPSIEATFLGQPALTAVGPARIALRTGATVVVGTAAPAASGLCFSAVRIETGNLGDDAESERVLTERINTELSRRILALPAHWVWMHDRFAAPRR